jgi:hypothetical protein
MSRKHHSDSIGGAASASSAKRRTTRLQPTASSSASSGPQSPAMPFEGPGIDSEAISRLAYSYWEARGYVGGSAEEDWLRAEQELRANMAAGTVA